MAHTKKIIKNSVILVIQPLVLNLIAIIVVGYVARKLGEVDYGRFIFASTFVLMFYGLSGLGMRTITVREIAEDKAALRDYLGKMLALRFGVSLITVVLIAVSINLMGYPPQTKNLVYVLQSCRFL
jgi:O-antigen/teichoic acid export membrane protein